MSEKPLLLDAILRDKDASERLRVAIINGEDFIFDLSDTTYRISTYRISTSTRPKGANMKNEQTNAARDAAATESDIQNRADFESAVHKSVRCSLCEWECKHPLIERFPWIELDRMFNVWNAAISFARAERDGQWIPCSERLPEESAHYLVTWEDLINYDPQDVMTAFFHQCLDEWDINPNAQRIIVWQPLPAPYTEGGSEDGK